jgi:hypothetical protein
MSRHELEGNRAVEPAAAGDAPVRDAAAMAHDDLAMRLPDWDLLPVAEFVRRRPASG